MVALQPFDAVKAAQLTMPPRTPYKVGDAFGPAGRGAFDALYGLNRPAENVVYTKPATENLEAVITKDGEELCGPGRHMENGRCVETKFEAQCQPGWVKKGDLCVAPVTELSVGNQEGVTGDRLKKYLQEMQTGTPVAWSESPIVLCAIAVLLSITGAEMYNRLHR